MPHGTQGSGAICCDRPVDLCGGLAARYGCHDVGKGVQAGIEVAHWIMSSHHG